MTLIKFFKKYRWAKKSMYYKSTIIRNKNICSLFYFKNGNFGDELNDELMTYFGLKYRRTRPLGSDTSAIGSNLQEYITNDSKSVSKKHTVRVLGSGFISKPKVVETFIFNMKFYALRGSLSKQRCEKILGINLSNVVLGDPGLLIPYIYPDLKLTKEYDVGIICHMVDKNSISLKNINLNKSKIIYIDVEQEPSQFVKQVAKCSFILSSAMHGLICADSLGIPNKHIILSESVVGGSYKFRDYYSVYPAYSYEPIDLRFSFITEKEINNYKRAYNINLREVDKICDNLHIAFSNFKKDLLNE